jgi:hypothetical protein
MVDAMGVVNIRAEVIGMLMADRGGIVAVIGIGETGVSARMGAAVVAVSGIGTVIVGRGAAAATGPVVRTHRRTEARGKDVARANVLAKARGVARVIRVVTGLEARVIAGIPGAAKEIVAISTAGTVAAPRAAMTAIAPKAVAVTAIGAMEIALRAAAVTAIGVTAIVLRGAAATVGVTSIGTAIVRVAPTGAAETLGNRARRCARMRALVPLTHRRRQPVVRAMRAWKAKSVRTVAVIDRAASVEIATASRVAGAVAVVVVDVAAVAAVAREKALWAHR